MSRRTQKEPSYRLHKQSGQAMVTLPDGFCGRRDVLLGIYDTDASRATYHSVLAEWRANGRRLRCADSDTTALTVNRRRRESRRPWSGCIRVRARIAGTTCPA